MNDYDKIKQEKLNKRFTRKHKYEFDDNWQKRPFKYSSWELMYKVSDDEKVLDVGCGLNPFKGKIKNILGIDPVKVKHPNYTCADIVTTLLDFETDEKFDVAFCLGSVQFGNEEHIKRQLNKLNSLLKPKARIYWRHRINGIATHPNDKNEVYDKEYFVWTFENMESLAKEYGFEQRNAKIDPNLVSDDKRLYAEWHRG